MKNILTEAFHGPPPPPPPQRLVDGRTHLGSINSLSHASSVFSLMTNLRDSAWAKAGLDLDGMNLNVGKFNWHVDFLKGRQCHSWLIVAGHIVRVRWLI